MTQISGVIIFILFNGIGFLLLTKSLKTRRLCKKAEKWSSATATILDSKAEEDNVRNAMGQVSNFYLVLVNYEYTVSGKFYQGNRVTFGRPAFDFVTSSNIIEQFAVGKQVPVYYNPADPADCVLAPKTKVGILSLIPGIFFMALGVLVGLISIPV